MKKIAMTLAIVLGMGMASFADNGGMFGRGEEPAGPTRLGGLPSLPGHGEPGNQPAPVGSGIAVLMGLGAAYAMSKRQKKD